MIAGLLNDDLGDIVTKAIKALFDLKGNLEHKALKKLCSRTRRHQQVRRRSCHVTVGGTQPGMSSLVGPQHI